MFRKSYSFPSILSCQLSMLMGAAAGYSAILIPQLKQSNSSIPITAADASWIASLGIICRPFGVMLEGFIVDRFGRKTGMQIVTFFFILSWLCTALSQSLLMLCASRMLLSFTLGMIICVGLYIAEITTPEDRGTFLSLITPATNLGILLVYFLGSLLPWKMVALLFAAYSALILFLLRYIPESPIWYMLRHRKSEATSVLLKFRDNDTEAVQLELNEIRQRMKRHESTARFAYLKHFTCPSAWKPFVIFTVFSFLQQQAGYNVIIYYAVDFFGLLSGAGPDHQHALTHTRSLIFAGVSLLGSLLLVTVVHKFNRVTLLVFSGVCMSATIGVAATVKGAQPANRDWDAVPIVCVYAYIFFCMLGMIDIPWMMIGEILPNHLRGVMSAAITVIIFFLSFLNVKLYNEMVARLGIAGILWSFGAFSLLSVLFAKKFFPETRGKALFEIEEYFRK